MHEILLAKLLFVRFPRRKQDVAEDMNGSVFDNDVRCSYRGKSIDFHGVEAIVMLDINTKMAVLKQCREVDLNKHGVSEIPNFF